MPSRRIPNRPATTTRQVHFEDFEAKEFERLAFAYVAGEREWKTLDWYGQVGGDAGRDIWGEDKAGGTHCIQCANHQRLQFAKAQEDIDKVGGSPNGLPGRFVVVVGGTVSAKLRDRIKTYATSAGVTTTEVWSGVEFEERLRRDQPELVRRFLEGGALPESAPSLRALVAGTDHDMIAALAQCFDRPAFTTEFREESSLPDFKKAITDTIEALNTGVRRLRDGTEFERIPNRHRLRDPVSRDTLARVVEKLERVRSAFDRLARQESIRPCGCGKTDCPVFMMSNEAADEMNYLRSSALDEFRRLHPTIQVRPRRAEVSPCS